MKFLLNAGEMKQCDENTMKHYGMLSAVLMERAALAAAEEICRRFPDEDTSVLVVCGTGNNGGDGVAVARLLCLKGYRAEIVFPGKEEKSSEETKRQLAIAKNYRVPFHMELPERTYDVVVDALFGIGLCRSIEGMYAALIARMNQMPGFKVAVDISSGVSAQDGNILGVAFAADLTVTFGFGKIGQYLYPGAMYSGEVCVKDIGIDDKSLLEIKPQAGILEKSDLSLIPARKDRSNKGSYGKLLVIAGTENMAGAAAFSAKAAYACGCGLVRIVTHKCNRQIIQTLVPEAVLSTYDADTEIEPYISEQLAWADAAVAGPGIGTSDLSYKMMRALLQHAEIPCVIDADGLNVLARCTEKFAGAKFPVIITPHLGEMSRLSRLPVGEIQNQMISVARSYAKEYNVVTVLKDARTVIALPDGFCCVNTAGNHGMATAGSGDVLAGTIGALLGQKVPAGRAAYLGVLLHAAAGDAAAERVGKTGLMASDLINGIREVLKEGNR